jgi:hypothetical protein
MRPKGKFHSEQTGVYFFVPGGPLGESFEQMIHSEMELAGAVRA